MILEVDAGNTFIKWRYRQGNAAAAASGRWLTREFSVASLADCPEEPQQVLAGSVAGVAFEQALSESVASVWGVPVRFARTATAAAGVRNSYADPARMGVDRWLVMLAAWQRCGQACCIIDCGSAITIDLLGAEGEHLGGYILPGLRLMRQVLTGSTAGILVDRDIEVFSLEPGCDTSSAVAHGTNLMFSSLAQMLPRWLEQQQTGAPLLVTGGDGALFCELMGMGELVPDLVLDGLRWALE
jgi:type III pantothenate kinase